MNQGLLWILAGIALMIAFVYTNWVLDRRWFPETGGHAAFGARTHKLIGLGELALFTLAIAFFTAGCLIIGTLHPSA